MAHILQAGISSLFGRLSAASSKIAEEWGEAVDWMTMEQGLNRAKEEGKMVVAIVRKDDCRKCARLKSAFLRNKELQRLAQNFVMVNVHADEVEEKQEFRPDGIYTPRILFFDMNGRLMPRVKRESTETGFHYSYGTETQLANVMKKVLDKPTRYIQRRPYN